MVWCFNFMLYGENHFINSAKLRFKLVHESFHEVEKTFHYSWNDSRMQLRKQFQIWFRGFISMVSCCWRNHLVKTPFYAWIQCSSIPGMDSRRYCMGGKSFRMIAWFYAMEKTILWMVPCTWGNHLTVNHEGGETISLSDGIKLMIKPIFARLTGHHSIL